MRKDILYLILIISIIISTIIMAYITIKASCSIKLIVSAIGFAGVITLYVFGYKYKYITGKKRIIRAIKVLLLFLSAIALVYLYDMLAKNEFNLCKTLIQFSLVAAGIWVLGYIKGKPNSTE